jgi:20S proteasome subunit beta 3
MVATTMEKTFKMNDRLFVGLSGLSSDVQSVAALLEFRLNLYSLREERIIAPKTFAHLLGQILYEKRFGPYFVEPVVAGLNPDGTPFVTAMDLIGAPVVTSDFVVAGTASENLYGMCEGLYRPDLSPDELFEVASQALLASVDRDALAGWGAVVHVITPEGVMTRELKARQD